MIDILTLPATAGGQGAWSLPVWVSFCLDGRASNCGFPVQLSAEIARLPEARAQRQLVHDRLSDWRRYLQILERTAREKQFAVSYRRYRLDSSAKSVKFELQDVPPATGTKIDAARGQQIHVIERAERVYGDQWLDQVPGNGIDNEPLDWLLGTIERLDALTLQVSLDQDVAERIEQGYAQIPRSGTLQYKALGDLVQIKRLQYGLSTLEHGQSENSHLGDFLFNPYEARLPDPERKIEIARDQLLQPELNEGQMTAVSGALNAPDLFLIQGPPGTGKTTVIAEICYQVALRGGRTLVASQANLAVDNAMSRLVHDPSIRALRRGRAESVEQEGQLYLEENVIATWLSRVAQDCQGRLDKQRERIQQLVRLKDLAPSIRELASHYLEHDRELKPAQERLARAHSALDLVRGRVNTATRSLAVCRQVNHFVTVANAQLSQKMLEFESLEQHASQAQHGPIDLDLGALDQGWDQLAVLEAEFAKWLPGSSTSSKEWISKARTRPSGRVSDSHGLYQQVLDFVQATLAARSDGDELLRQIEAGQSTYAGYFDLGIEWYQANADWQASCDRRQTLAQQALDAEKEAQRLEHEDVLWTERMQQIVRLRDLEHSQDVQEWLEEATLAGHSALGEPPSCLSGDIGRWIWQAVRDGISLSDVWTARHALKAAQDEQRELVTVLDQLEGVVSEFLVQTSTKHIAQQTQSGITWKNSILGELLTPDSHGALRLSPGADGTLRQIVSQVRSALLSEQQDTGLFGGRQPPKSQIAGWYIRFRTLASALDERRRALEDRIQGLALRLSRRHSRCAEEIETLIVAQVNRLVQNIGQSRSRAQGQLQQSQKTLGSIRDELASLDREIDQLARAKSTLKGRLTRGRHQLRGLLPLEPLSELVCQIQTYERDQWTEAWRSAADRVAYLRDQLGAIVARITPDAAIQALKETLDEHQAQLESDVDAHNRALSAAQSVHDSALAALERTQKAFASCQEQWHAIHNEIPEAFLPKSQEKAIDDLAYVAALASASAGWEASLDIAERELERFEGLVTDWIQRVKARDERDEAGFKQIYIDNANVIGITCVQAGSRQFSEAYRNFDYVIVDEVSKATPPELLLPMLKGAKIILVGDSRQLPPMVGPQSLIDLAEELNVDQEDVEHLKRSLFKELFESCPDELEMMLTDQYRMHPQIMDAINQFYDEKLNCRIADPDLERAHRMDTVFAPENHIVWVPTPLSDRYAESRVGTSFCNNAEVDLIEGIVQQLDRAWAAVENNGMRKEVGVITFYAAQAHALRQRLVERPPEKSFENLRLRVGTVDRFQGMERPIVIVSLVRNNPRGDIGFARAPERVNVGFSRAQELLIIVGSQELFCRRARSVQASQIYSRVADVVRRSGGAIDLSSCIPN